MISSRHENGWDICWVRGSHITLPGNGEWDIYQRFFIEIHAIVEIGITRRASKLALPCRHRILAVQYISSLVYIGSSLLQLLK